MRIGILTVSDRGSRGEREDLSGKLLEEMLVSSGSTVVVYEIVPDDQRRISSTLKEWVDDVGVDLIFTTGGTGLSPRDVTPEATLSVVDRLAAGFAEVMRAESLKVTPKAMLSRAVAGLRKQTLIINLPGSPKAVEECLAVLLPTLPHAVEVLRGEALECGGGEQQGGR